MKYIYVLEDDPRLQKQIFEAVKKSEPQGQVRFFDTLEKFQKWIILCIKSGQEALFQGGEKWSGDPEAMTTAKDPSDELILFISKDEFLGSHYMALIRKVQAMFIRKGICTAADPTRLVFTAFESPKFDIKLVEDRIVSNVIFKPFDELILQQHLHFAIKGHHPASQSFVYAVQTAHEVEMTKEVQMEAVGDVGFVTRSPRPLDVGVISKYYGDVFKSTGRTHVMGVCLACEPHPQFPQEFQVWFSYFGIPSRQISDIRKNIALLKQKDFTVKTPLKTQQPGLEWILLDPQKDRAEKYKSLLEGLFKARVLVISSFSDFYFQCDPVGLEKSRQEKTWQGTETLKLQLDASGEKVLKVFPEDQAQKRIFGQDFFHFQKTSFSFHLHEFSRSIWKRWISQGMTNGELLALQKDDDFFTVKAKSFTRHHEGFELELIEPDNAEKAAWYSAHFPTPAKAHALLIGEEYLYEERLSFWEEFVKKAHENKNFPRMMGLYKQVPGEEITRRLTWMEDIFEASNETPYLQRKLKWRGGEQIKDHADGSPAYLTLSHDLIRVANPVSVVELSEAGLVINYYRPLDLGVFRKFVLTKTGQDTFSEYSANCNYTTEHPTEKNLFQNHFVFFGITDAYLKSIRVWILDNYIHSKQEDN